MYDEPTAGLDPVASTVEDLMRNLHTGNKTAASYEEKKEALRAILLSRISTAQSDALWTGSSSTRRQSSLGGHIRRVRTPARNRLCVNLPRGVCKDR